MEFLFFYKPLLVLSIIFAVFALWLFETEKKNLSLIFLFVCSCCLGLFIGTLDPFINLWDEQYHALVAKNLIENPFKPILIKEPVFGFLETSWSYCHVWLHKQPLFLWQIALSLKFFGLTEIGVRFPSVLMHALLVFFVYRTGKLLVSSKTGFYGALMFTFSYFPIEFVSGFYPTDHNDNAFFFYSFLSIWALIEYGKSKKLIFLILIGIFSGCAILCKWLTGLIVYAAWLAAICFGSKKHILKSQFKDLFLSLFICCVVFLPWQIFAFSHYPKEYGQSMAFNSKHVFQALEGHGGDVFFYYNALYEQFGEGLFIPPLVLLCFVLMVKMLRDKTLFIICITVVTLTYLFFTLVKTKMYGYVFDTFPFFILGIAFALEKTQEKIAFYIKSNTVKKLISTILLLTLSFFLFDFEKIYKHHSNKDRAKSRNNEIKEKQFYKAVKEKFVDDNYLIFNANMSFESHVLAIFYTDFPAFGFVLTKSQIEHAKALKYKLLAIDDKKLPEYIINDNEIVKIRY